MNRFAGIGAAAVGLVIALLGALKVVPGLTGTGVVLILLGGLVIGLSFISGPEQDETPRMSTGATLGNIFVSPGEVFQNLRRHPRWLVAMLIIAIMSGTYSVLFINRITAERIVNFQTDKTLELPMLADNPEARKNIEAQRVENIALAKSPVLQAAHYITDFSGKVFLAALFAFIFFLFSLAMGGKINYWQSFSATVYAWFPYAVIKYLLSTLVLFLKDPVEVHPILGQSVILQDSLNFLVAANEHPVLYTFLGAFSLLWFYWIFMNATGLKNAGEKMTSTAAWSATLAIWFIGLCMGLVLAFAFPSFIS